MGAYNLGSESQCLSDLTSVADPNGDVTGVVALLGCFSSHSTETPIPYFTPKDSDFAEFMIGTYGSVSSDINASSFLSKTNIKPAGYVGAAASADFYESNIVNGYRYSTSSGDRATWIHPPYFPDVPVYPTNTPDTPSNSHLLKVRNSCAAYCYQRYLDPVLLPYSTSGQTIQFILAYGRCSCIQPNTGHYVTAGAGHNYLCCKPMTSTPYAAAINNASMAIPYNDITSPNALGIVRPNMCAESETYGVVYELRMDCPLNASFCGYYPGTCSLTTTTSSGNRCCLLSGVSDNSSSSSMAQQVAQWLVAIIVFAVVGQFIYWLLRLRRKRQQDAQEAAMAEAAVERLMVAGAQGEELEAAGGDGHQIDDQVGVLPPLEAFEREMANRNRVAAKDGIELLLIPGVLMGPPSVVTVWQRTKKECDTAAAEAAAIMPFADPSEIDPEECCPMCTDELTQLVDEMGNEAVAVGTGLDRPLLVDPEEQMMRKATPETNVVRMVCNHMIHRTCMVEYMSYSLKSYLCTIQCPICRATALVQQQAIKQQRLRKELYHFRKMAEAEVLRLVQIGAKAVPPRRGAKRGTIVFHDGSLAITEQPFRAFIKPVPIDKIGESRPVTKAEAMLLRREVIETLRQQTMHSVLESLARSDLREQYHARGLTLAADTTTRKKLDMEVLMRLTPADRELLDTMETRVARQQFGEDVQPSYRWRNDSPMSHGSPSVLLAALPNSRSASEESDDAGFRFAEALIDAQSPASNGPTLSDFREAPVPPNAAPRRLNMSPSPPGQNPPIEDDDAVELAPTQAATTVAPLPTGHPAISLTAAQLDAAGSAEYTRNRTRDDIASNGFVRPNEVRDEDLPQPDEPSSDDGSSVPSAAARARPGRRREQLPEVDPPPSPRSGVVLLKARNRRRGQSAHRGVEGIPQPINRSRRVASKSRRNKAPTTSPKVPPPAPVDNANMASSLESLDLRRSGTSSVVHMDDDEEIQ